MCWEGKSPPSVPEQTWMTKPDLSHGHIFTMLLRWLTQHLMLDSNFLTTLHPSILPPLFPGLSSFLSGQQDFDFLYQPVSQSVEDKPWWHALQEFRLHTGKHRILIAPYLFLGLRSIMPNDTTFAFIGGIYSFLFKIISSN